MEQNSKRFFNVNTQKDIDNYVDHVEAQFDILYEQDDEQLYAIQNLQKEVETLREIVCDLVDRINYLEMDKLGYHFN